MTGSWAGALTAGAPEGPPRWLALLGVVAVPLHDQSSTAGATDQWVVTAVGPTGLFAGHLLIEDDA